MKFRIVDSGGMTFQNVSIGEFFLTMAGGIYYKTSSTVAVAIRRANGEVAVHYNTPSPDMEVKVVKEVLFKT